MDNHPEDRHVAAAAVHIGAAALALRTLSVRKNRPPMSPAEVVAAIVRQQGFRALEDSLHVLVDRHRRDCDEDGLTDHLWIQDVAYPKWVNSTESLVFVLETGGNSDTRRNRRLAKYLAMPVEHTTPHQEKSGDCLVERLEATRWSTVQHGTWSIASLRVDFPSSSRYILGSVKDLTDAYGVRMIAHSSAGSTEKENIHDQHHALHPGPGFFRPFLEMTLGARP